MKTRAILFSGPMVRALLDGSKTQTRRVVKKPEALGCLTDSPCNSCGCDVHLDHGPYGAVGDRLWVRESFWVVDCPFYVGPHYLYAEEFERYGRESSQEEYDAGKSWMHRQGDTFWAGRSCGMRFGHVPSIHMPRWASRLTLEITDVRVERLNDISEMDARAEGVRFDGRFYLGAEHAVKGTPKVCNTPRDAFYDLWQSINGARPGCAWRDNPWVWALTFRVV